MSVLELRFNEENSDQLLNYLLVSPSPKFCATWNGQVRRYPLCSLPLNTSIRYWVLTIAMSTRQFGH